MLDDSTLYKVATMALQGAPGEMDAAQRILEQHNTTAVEVLNKQEEMVEIRVSYRTAAEKQLIIQLYCKTLNVTEFDCFRIRQAKMIGAWIPKSKRSKFESDCETVLSLWRKEVKSFLNGFIVKNRLWPDKETGEDSKLTTDELMDIMSKASSAKEVCLNDLLEE